MCINHENHVIFEGNEWLKVSVMITASENDAVSTTQIYINE